MANISEILSMSSAERKTHYKADGIDVVKIDGVIFTDYSAFSFLYEKSYIKSPVRSGDGTIGNLNSYATFLTPHLKIDFGLLSIDSYRALMTLLYEKNEFLVECYDVVNNKVQAHKMYFSTEEMPKLWTIARAIAGDETYIELLGVQDYTVEMVGTNSSLDEVEILYYDENGNLIPEATQTVIKGTEVIIRYDYIPYTNKRFDGVWLDENNKPILNGTAIKPSETKKLYVQVEDTNRYKLTLNYGNGIDVSDNYGVAITTVDISKGETIGNAFNNAELKDEYGNPISFFSNGTGSKVVNVNGTYYEPYEFKGWYWTIEENANTKVTANTVFNYDINRTLYQIYSPKNFNVHYETNYTLLAYDDVQVQYAMSVPLPRPKREGYTLVGWYTDSAFYNLFSGKMPPYSITLYAKWEVIK